MSGNNIVECNTVPKISLKYYLTNDTQKAEHTVDLTNASIAEQNNDFFIITPDVSNATYTLTMENTFSNATIYSGVFYASDYFNI